VQDWWQLCAQPLTPVIAAEDLPLTTLAVELLPEGEITLATWDIWLAAIQQKTERRGKKLFMPIRLALTGMANGPELKQLLPLLPRKTIIARLRGA
jgi:glutamyl-tRNA synthetase